MMVTSVIINDLVTNKRTSIILNPAIFQTIKSIWEREEKILIEMQSASIFTGRRRWCDLDPTHFRLMIARNLTLAAELSTEERVNDSNPIVLSLNHLLAALANCIQTRTESTVDMLRVIRVSEIEVMYDFTASLNRDSITYKPTTSLRIIVDNE